MTRRAARECGALLALALVVLGAGLGLRHPWPPDEPRFALIAHELLASGEWLFPRVAGVLYADKPPLGIWLIAVAELATGSRTLAFLLPTLAAALGTLALVYDLGRRLWNHRVGLAAAAALLTTLQFALQAKTAQLDALLTFCVTLSLYGLVRHALRGPAWGWYAIGGAAAGLGVLTKGVGVIAFLALLPFAFARLRAWPSLPRYPARAYAWLAAPVAAAVVVLAWLLPMLVEAAGNPALAAYRDEILLRQTVQRYVAPWHHFKAWWYYLVQVIPPFWLPLSALLPWALPAWRRRLARRDARQLVLLGFVVLVLVFFSLSPGKRGVYVLPALPAVALAMAPLLPGLLARRGVQISGAALLALCVACLAAVPLWNTWLSPTRGVDLAARHGIAPWGLLWSLAALGTAWLAWGRLARGMHAFAGFLLSAWTVYGLVGYPLLDHARSARSLMAAVETALPPGGELALVDWEEQFVLQARRPVVHFGYRRAGSEDEVHDALAWLLVDPARRALVSMRREHRCVERLDATALGRQSRREWLLVGRNAVRPHCRLELEARQVRPIRVAAP